MVVSINAGTPNSWMVQSGKHHLQMDDDVGVTLFQETSICTYTHPARGAGERCCHVIISLVFVSWFIEGFIKGV